MSFLDRLLNMPGAARIALSLLRRPWSTFDEAAEGILVSEDRVRHILQKMYVSGLVERRPREAASGRRPFEYQLVRSLRDEIHSLLLEDIH